jgi:hypothetical protein|tara:strand:- start:7366 stop:7599 length:234 start_codon:yes stop_codon:yes gene_type:complete
MEWLSWTNGAYLAAIIIGGGMTFAAAKYKNLLKEIKEALNTYHEAAKDGKITEAERDKIVKEVLDIASAGVKIFWKW